MSTEKNKNEPEAEDAPQTGPIPEDQEERLSNTSMPEVTDGGRDPSRIPAEPGHQIPNLEPNDEQAAIQKEVEEGVDRAENDQRRVAQSPSERPPESGE